MATIGIGDIHGHLRALEDLLAQLRQEASKDDVVVFLGDYIDRGPEPKGCVDAILTFERETAADVVCLCGNHEEAFLRTLRTHQHHSWLLGMEGFDTVKSYSEEAADVLLRAAYSTKASLYLGHGELPYQVFFDAIPESHLSFFDRLLPYYRNSDCICTHGGLDPRIARFEDQPQRALIWGVKGFEDTYVGTDTIVYGHWSNADIDADLWPRPKIAGNSIGIDTILHGVLTAIRLPDRRVIQSNRYDY